MTQTSTPGTAPVFPPGRYGRRREPTRGRWVVPVVLSATVAVMLLLAVKLYQQYGTEKISATVQSLTDVSPSSITVTFTVHKPDGVPVTCTVDALAVDGSALGTAEVSVPAGNDVTVTYTVHTTARAYIAQVPTCRAAS